MGGDLHQNDDLELLKKWAEVVSDCFCLISNQHVTVHGVALFAHLHGNMLSI